jgi:hypothetical protein
LLENISKLIELECDRQGKEASSDEGVTSSSLVNNYLKLVNAAVALPAYASRDHSAVQTSELTTFY